MRALRSLATAALACLLIGCRGVGTQKFVAFAPEQAAKLESASRNVVDVRCKVLQIQADYSFWENLHMLAPMPNRTKFDMSFEVERAVKGEAHGRIFVHWLRNPTPAQCAKLGIPPTGGWETSFTNGMPLRIGFSRQTDKGLEDLKILVRHRNENGN